MSAPGPNSGPHRQRRPLTIAELAAVAQDNLWDPTKGIKHWLRTAEKARRTGDMYVEENDYERAFIEYAKAATIVLEKLPTHKDYQSLLNAEQRHNLGLNGQDILDSLSRLKPVLVDRYERWRSQEGSSAPSSTSSTPDPLSRDELLRRRREEQQRLQEEERARQALEAARQEDMWKREQLAQRQADLRHSRQQAEYARDEAERLRREEAAADEARRLEQERAAQMERQRREEEARQAHAEQMRREEEMARVRAEEAQRQEQEIAARRQLEANMAAMSVRRDHVQQDSTPRRQPEPEVYSNGYSHSFLPLESPARNDDDSSTDVEGSDPRVPWQRNRHADQTPTKPRQSGIVYPPPITTTSPPPPDLGPIRYPSLMSQHQLKQGYVPSLRSMFSKPDLRDSTDSSLLFDSKPAGDLYSNILPRPSAPIEPPPVIPPYPDNYRSPQGYVRQDAQAYGHRGPSPSGARPPPPPTPAKETSYGRPPGPAAPSRIVPSTSKDPAVPELRTIKLPRECLPRFLSIARMNTLQNRETCGLLLGKDKGRKYVVTTLLIPKQHSTSDTCTMDEEELVLKFTEERHLITLGWIHTHPTQSCFMSSVDLHTHSGFQRMLPESFAVVCAPSSTPTFGLFRLTDPGGLQVILDCKAKEAFHPHPEVPIYTDCDNSHVQMKDMPLEIVDLRFE
ncbi:Mov34-domain-containing protein [Obba rivulosa]|uniref:Mov34-domain-containing protein n=1 Tax=Obba rivulosa TaxID=1052685 RepID=A0A8E2DKX8_9APHY|nr:Mov34-domain-containing protein [Obba rivulosa]